MAMYDIFNGNSALRSPKQLIFYLKSYVFLILGEYLIIYLINRLKYAKKPYSSTKHYYHAASSSQVKLAQLVQNTYLHYILLYAERCGRLGRNDFSGQKITKIKFLRAAGCTLLCLKINEYF